MSVKIKKRSWALLLASVITLTAIFAPLPTSAVETAAPVAPQVVAGVDDGLLNEQKAPRQVNVHMGDDPSTQVNFTYTTVADAATRVVLNKLGDAAEITVDGNEGIGQGNKFFHAISVSGLEPHTTYQYTVGYGENTYSGKFKTALPKGSKDSFKFAYLADTQVSNASNAKALGATLSEVNRIPGLDFVYIAGDVTDTANSESQWEQLFNNSGAFPDGGQEMFGNNLLAVVQGNHDNNMMYRHINAPAQEGNIVYSFDYGPATFILLNLETAVSDATARAKQKDFLTAKVADAKARGQWTIVGFHKSLVTGASHIVDSDVVDARKYWCPVFAELDVDMVLQGHDHVYSRGFVTADGVKADRTVDTDGKTIDPANAPLYMIGGHAGGLKWYSKINYIAAPEDPIAPDYSFLDVDSASVGPNGEPGSDIKQEQVIVEMEISNSEVNINTYMFKYNTDTDTITTGKYLFDTLTVKRTVQATNNLTVSTDANLIKKGDYFKVDAAFENTVSSNTAVLDYVYDTSKFEYRGFVPAEGVSLLDYENTGTGVRLTVMIPDYQTTDYGQTIFSAKEDADLKNEDNAITLNASYVVKAEDGTKTIAHATASTTFTTGGANPGDVNGDGDTTLLDLSDIIDVFGMLSTDPQWNRYKFYDFNHNNRIDIQDIVAIARLIG